MKDNQLSMILPENVVYSEEPGTAVFKQSVGDLKNNEVFQKEISLIVFGPEQTVKDLKMSVSYFPESLGPQARFAKNKTIKVSVRETAVKLNLITAEKVLNNEDFEIQAAYQNISQTDLENLELEISAPSIFTLASSNMPPSAGNDIWTIEKLGKEKSGENLVLHGRVIGAEGGFFEIKASFFMRMGNKKYLLNEKTARLTISSSPLSLEITVNDQRNYLVFEGTSLRYQLNYANNSGVGLNDAIITAQLIGEMFDFKTLNGNGFFSSQNNTITWNTANAPELRLIPAGAKGKVEFQIKTLASYPIHRISDKDFILKVKGEISSPTVPYYIASDKTIGLTTLETKIGGRINLESSVWFNTPESDITNSGPLPPKVNQPTTFTVRWRVKNYATDVSDVEIKSFLQSGARWTGVVKSNIDALPIYNDRTQEIIWKIDNVPAAKGIVNSPIEAEFQIEVTPAVNQIDKALSLLSQTDLTAFDKFASANLKAFSETLNTQMVSDSNFNPRDGLAIE